MTDLLSPLLAGYKPHLSTSHVAGKVVLWVSPYRITDNGQIDMLSREGPFRDIAAIDRAFAGRLKLSAQDRKDCGAVR